MNQAHHAYLGHGAEGFHVSEADPRRAEKAASHYWKVSNECVAFRALVKTMLMYPRNHKWTTQGFGMMRTYLPHGPNPKRFRLNVWDAKMATPHVSTMHDHPWDFQSWIINGNFRNTRFVEDAYNGDPWEYMTIMCGECGGAKSGSTPIRLRAFPTEHYTTGDIYRQKASEIHVSEYDDGTVTLNDRTGDTEHARVFWPAGSEWVDAKPRPATDMEVATATMLALEKWHDEIA